MRKLLKFFVCFGVFASACVSAFFFALFLIAYFSPTQSILMPINNYGEASLELIFLLGMMVIIISSTVWAIKTIGRSK